MKQISLPELPEGYRWHMYHPFAVFDDVIVIEIRKGSKFLPRVLHSIRVEIGECNCASYYRYVEHETLAECITHNAKYILNHVDFEGPTKTRTRYAEAREILRRKNDYLA